MLRNFITVAFRSMARQLSYSLINIVGLAIGIACSLVIFLFVYGEWSYNRGWENSDRIYRVSVSFFNMGTFSTGPERLLNVLPGQYDGIEAATRIQRERDLLVEANNQPRHETNAFYIDSAFFKVFNYDFISGSGVGSPNDVVITESTANKYFGSSDVIGKPVLVGPEKKEFFITGVVKDINFNSTLQGNIFISNRASIVDDQNWGSASFHNYVLLKDNQSKADLEAALDRVLEKNVFPEFGKQMGMATFDEYKANSNAVRFHLLGLRDIYLQSTMLFEMVPGGNEMNVYIFSAIALFVLALAGVNFINLTTARASRRAKEVGIRKTMGTSRGKLIAQFLSESVMISTVAMVLALLLAEIFSIVFAYVTGAPLTTSIWSSPVTVVLFGVFSVVVGLLSGLYPAFYLTAFNPVRVLKGNVSAKGGAGFRNILVVFQFAVSMILIVCALIVQQQLHYVQTKELGFDQNNVLTIDGVDELGNDKAEVFKNELQAQAGVLKAAVSAGEPGSKRWMHYYKYQTADMPEGLSINTYPVGDDYLDLMGIKLIQGRTFNDDLESDSSAIILNESALLALGIDDDPLNAVINKNEKVIGVVPDFHWESLHNKIGPVAFRRGKRVGQISFKIEPGNVKDFLAVAETKWKALVPNETFAYHFVDQNFSDMLAKDEVFAKAINFFTLLAIFISCLGLYGLSAFTAEQRTKEIGIRKVLGASSSQIVVMLNKKFTILVSIAIVISIPLATWLMSQWLDTFAYKTAPGAWLFIGAVSIALLTAWITVSLHSVKASWVNPSEALKYE